MFIDERSAGRRPRRCSRHRRRCARQRGRGYVDYQVGIFNEMGDSQNTTDQNDQKATIGRVAFRIPMSVGLFSSVRRVASRADPSRRSVASAPAVKRNFALAGSRVRSEVMGARDGTTRRLGYYGLGAVRPTPDLELVGALGLLGSRPA